MNVTTTSNPSDAKWQSTGWSIGTTAPGTVTCVNHDNHNSAGTYSETFTITAPASADIYNAYFIVYNNDHCTSGASAIVTMANAVTVDPNLGPAPTATTNAASGVTSWVATLNGTVSSNGTSSTVSFEYGLTAAYGNSIAATQSPLASGATNAAVSADLVGLNCNTIFHYRVVATNSGGTTNGSDGTFTTSACGAPYPATACAATRYGSNLGCTANDVHLSNIATAPGSISSCVSGTPVTLDLDLTVNFASPDRWDIGIFIANDGKSPAQLTSSGGASSCSVDVLPTTAPFLDLDGTPQGTTDICGDGNNSINGGTGSGVKRMTGVTLPCYASPQSGGKLFIPYVVSWDNQKSPIGNLCKSNVDPVPNTTSKCNVPSSTVAINVVVLPVITKTDGTTTLNPGANTTYTVVITNNTGGTLLDSVFKDPVVTNLTVNSVTCAAATGATCPTTTVSDMQGGGISIPSANLPNNGSLTFTVNANVASNAPVGSHIINTASVTVGGSSTTSATDDDLVEISPSAVVTFAPSTITEGAVSLLTITLTNPFATAVTGVSFTDIYPSGMVNTANASPTTTCGGTVTAVDNGNSLVLSGGTIPASGSCTVTVYVTSATAGNYTNSTGLVATSNSGNISATSAILTVNTAVFGNFNACDDAADPNVTCTNTTTVTNSHITTKIAGSPFTLDLVVLKSNGSWNSSYSKSVIVDLLDSSDNSGAFDSYNCRSSWTNVIATLGYNPTFSGSNGQISIVASSGSFNVSEAYRDVRVRVTKNGSGAVEKGCSTDNFAIRPNILEVNPTDANWQAAGTARALSNADITSPGSSTGTPYPIHKAGQPFTVTATAKDASTPNIRTANYWGSPTSVLSACGGTACAASLGAFTLGATNFVSGILISNTATYSEVGAFNLALQDTDFASVDAADTPATCNNVVDAQGHYGRYVCGTTAMGRFVPDHFALTQGTATPACNAGGFTYFGQDGFSTVFTLTAQNASNATTTNYAGDGSTGLAKLPLTVRSGFGFAVSTWSPSQPVDAALDASSSAPTATNANTWVSGSTTVTAKHMIKRSAITPSAPTTVTVSALPVDADGVTMPAAADVSPGTLLRYGRLSLQNAYGSELLNLPIPVEAQYWSGSYYTVNTNDSCTTFPASSFSMGNYLSNLSACETQFLPSGSLTMSGGILSPSLNLTAPGAGNTGSVDLALNIGSSASGNTCTSAVEGSATTTNMPWFGTNPSARATFGIYKGNSKFIYIRELY